MRGLVALREGPTQPHLYLTVPEAELRRHAISTVLALTLDAQPQGPAEFMYFIFKELSDLLEAYELRTYPTRLICDPGDDVADAYPLLDMTHCTLSWYQLSTSKVTTRVSFETAASLAA